MNQVFLKFLSRQPPATSEFARPEVPLATRMRSALAKLAHFRGDPSIAERTSLTPLSFSCTTAEVQKSQDETYQTYAKGERSAFSPLGPDGRPMRKYVCLDACLA